MACRYFYGSRSHTQETMLGMHHQYFYIGICGRYVQVLCLQIIATCL